MKWLQFLHFPINTQFRELLPRGVSSISQKNITPIKGIGRSENDGEGVVGRITLIQWPFLPQVITVVTDTEATQNLLKGMD